MDIQEDFAVLSDSYNDPETFKYIADTSKERYSEYKKAHHVWINDIEDGKFRDSLESVRKNKKIISAIKQQFQGSSIYPVTEGDEIYWSASPKEATGSDRSLVDCHYDSPFSIMPTGGVVYYRIIIAMNENNSVTTIFPSENKRVKMSTGDFHGLDYNKDWHCVEGSILPNNYRVLLKLHYLVVPQGTHQMWVDWVRFINVSWTKISRAAMRMSADPHTPIESLVAMFVNFSRFVFNNINTILIYLVGVFLVIFAISKRAFLTKKYRQGLNFSTRRYGR